MGIRVKAIGDAEPVLPNTGAAQPKNKAVGYYDHKRRYPGEEFEIQDMKDFSDKWMEKVDPLDSMSKSFGVAEAPHPDHEEEVEEDDPENPGTKRKTRRKK
jgi:hypothetical protein